jgi:hypothetical protein
VTRLHKSVKKQWNRQALTINEIRAFLDEAERNGLEPTVPLIEVSGGEGQYGQGAYALFEAHWSTEDGFPD